MRIAAGYPIPCGTASANTGNGDGHGDGFRGAPGRRAAGRGFLGASLVILPVLIGLPALGWYNAERIGSPFEFGHRYRLTGMNLHHDYGQVFSLSNVVINADNYLLRPLRLLSVFLYFKPDWGITAVPSLTWLGLHFPAAAILNPRLYYAEQVTGLVYTLPFAAFVLVAVAFALQRASPVDHDRTPAAEADQADCPSARAIIIALMIGSVLAFVPTLLFVVATTRYLADVVPTLVILASLGVWEWIAWRQRLGHALCWPLILTWLAALASVAVSLLLAVSGYDMRFEHLNPELFDRIVRFFAW